MDVRVRIPVFRRRNVRVIFEEFYKVIFAFKGELTGNLIHRVKRGIEKCARVCEPLIYDISAEQNAVSRFENLADIVFVISEMLGNEAHRPNLFVFRFTYSFTCAARRFFETDTALPLQIISSM